MSGKHVAQPEQAGLGNDILVGFLITLGILVGVLAAATAGLCIYAGTYDGIFPGVTAADGYVELGGLSREEARTRLETTLPALLEKSVAQIELEGRPLADYTAAQAGFSPKIDEMLDAAWSAGRDGGWLGGGLSLVRGWTGMGADIPLSLDRDDEKSRAVEEEIAAIVEKPAVDGSYELTREGLFATKHTDGVALDREGLQGMLTSIEPGKVSRLECPVTVESARALDPEALARELNAQASPARYDAQLGKVVDGQVGVELDVEGARNVLNTARQGERVELPAAVNYPAVTAREMEEVLFRDVLGTCTTSVSGSSARRGNVRLAGESVNGTVLNPGDIFDYNKVVGERTAARGFGAAATYINGQTVDTIGGGICQVSSTVYKASLLSNLEIVERYNHRFYPGYITLGMDATVSWGGPEFRFRNNTDYPIRVDVTYENSKLTVTFMGTKTDDTYVEMTRKVLSTTGFETEYVETEALAWGTEKEKQNGYTGYVVESYRNVYAGDGTLISSRLEAKSVYSNRNRIIEVGIAGRPDTQTPTGGAGPEQADPGSADTGGEDIFLQPTQPEEGMPDWLQPGA